MPDNAKLVTARTFHRFSGGGAIPQVLVNGTGWSGLALLCSQMFFEPTQCPGAIGARGICVVLVR